MCAELSAMALGLAAFVFIILPPSFCQSGLQNDGGRTMEERRSYDLASVCIVSTVRLGGTL